MQRFAGVLFLLFFFVYPLHVQAANSALSSVPHASVDYELPYPGLLPDNPLYPIKVFRDKVVSFFITDAQKQATFDLLQADKRVAAGEYLLQEKDESKDSLIS